MPRFVLLYHDCPPHYERPSHWDLMLESGATLRTWALERLPCDWESAHSLTAKTFPRCPPIAEGNTAVAVALGDHRGAYLELEGPLSGNRGGVVRIDAGTYHSESESSDCWQIELAGGEISGRMMLQRQGASSSRWILECVRSR